MLIPVFPGTNCEYDSARAVETAGAEADIVVIRNLTADDVARSVEKVAKKITVPPSTGIAERTAKLNAPKRQIEYSLTFALLMRFLSVSSILSFALPATAVRDIMLAKIAIINRFFILFCYF